MKKTAIVFAFIMGLSVLCIFVAVKLCGVSLPFEYSFGSFRADARVVGGLLDNLSAYEKVFDDNFYKVASRENRNALKVCVENSPLKDMPPGSSFNLPEIYGVISKLFEYNGNVFAAKVAMSEDFPDGAAFAKNYDKLEYNYAAAEAFARIAEKISGIGRKGEFIPDKISEKIIVRGNCVADGEDYEKIFGWYVGYNALKTSFDVRYFQIMLGEPFLTAIEKGKIASEMNVLLSLLNSCRPPDDVSVRIGRDLDGIYKSYSAKRKLAEYQAFAFFKDDMQEMKFISDIYAARNISSVIASNLGYDAFKTLGSLAVFELYSKNYNQR